MLKITLETGKTLHMREMLISDQNKAAKNLSPGMNEAEMSMVLQQEILKLIIVKVNDKKLKGIEKENLDNLLKSSEYLQVLEVLKEMMGNAIAPKVEIVMDSEEQDSKN